MVIVRSSASDKAKGTVQLDRRHVVFPPTCGLVSGLHVSLEKGIPGVRISDETKRPPACMRRGGSDRGLLASGSAWQHAIDRNAAICTFLGYKGRYLFS